MTTAVAVVTGGTRGIGAATAALLARTGYALCLGYRSRDGEAAALAGELRGTGAKVRLVRCDVSDESDVDRLFAEADDLGTVTALVNCAGILEHQRPWSRTTRSGGPACSLST